MKTTYDSNETNTQDQSMIQNHSSKITMVHYIDLKRLGQFQQYIDDDAPWCHFINEYKDINQ